MVLFIISVSLLLLVVITKLFLGIPYGKHLITAGNHVSRPAYGFWLPSLYRLSYNNEIKWIKARVTIIGTKYYHNDLRDQRDINKILGYSTNMWQHHHKNSIRIGWRYNLENREVEIFAYMYDNGQRQSILLTTYHSIDIVKFDVEMCTTNSNHVIMIDDKCLTLPISVTPKKFGWVLKPYFGGNRVAPHDISFEIEKLK